MRLEKVAVNTELDEWQQKMFIDLLEKYKNDEDIFFGIKCSLTILGYRIIEEEKKGVD